MTHVLSLEVMAPPKKILHSLLCPWSDFRFLVITSLAVPMVEAMAALVLMDQLMAHIAQCEIFPLNLDLQEPVGSASSLSEMSILEQKSL
jgi:hypothetical protein